jgi:hypothetical protein
VKAPRRYLKTAVPLDEYQEVVRHADAEGLKLSAYLRAVLGRDGGPPNNGGGNWEELRDLLLPVLAELLQLARLIATRADAQAQSRITAAINQQFPNRSI